MTPYLKEIQMLDIKIKTIPHEHQRYNTVGDYQTDEGGKTTILVSDMGNDSWSLAIGLHELIESHLCKLAGISDEVIDKFDQWFDENREDDWPEEPGDHPFCPYYKQHQFASLIERQFIHEVGENWQDYDGTIIDMMDRD
ncbi:MAG: hypothetical protein H6780_04625 [Candidatus Nomurabacteria bacterium]|nr:MAG: hypothetical protein H6780_04625 [Candidatus Nomurabacteria bacterium]